MFKKILMPLDLGEKHQRAVQMTADLARQHQAEVLLLHVIETIAGVSMEEERDFYDRLEAASWEHLNRFGETLAEQRISWQGKILYGDRAAEIARYAEEVGADVIVVTSPRFDPENPALSWASLSYRVGILAPCPVLLVK